MELVVVHRFDFHFLKIELVSNRFLIFQNIKLTKKHFSSTNDQNVINKHVIRRTSIVRSDENQCISFTHEIKTIKLNVFTKPTVAVRRPRVINISAPPPPRETGESEVL